MTKTLNRKAEWLRAWHRPRRERNPKAKPPPAVPAPAPAAAPVPTAAALGALLGVTAADAAVLLGPGAVIPAGVMRRWEDAKILARPAWVTRAEVAVVCGAARPDPNATRQLVHRWVHFGLRGRADRRVRLKVRRLGGDVARVMVADLIEFLKATGGGRSAA